MCNETLICPLVASAVGQLCLLVTSADICKHSEIILPILQLNTGCLPIQKGPVFSQFWRFFPYLRILLGFIPKFKRHRLHPQIGNKITETCWTQIRLNKMSSLTSIQTVRHCNKSLIRSKVLVDSVLTYVPPKRLPGLFWLSVIC